MNVKAQKKLGDLSRSFLAVTREHKMKVIMIFGHGRIGKSSFLKDFQLVLLTYTLLHTYNKMDVQLLYMYYIPANRKAKKFIFLLFTGRKA